MKFNYKVGDTITYKDDICRILEVEPKTGNTKKAHMKQIEQYMKLERIGKGKGTKYQITEIYEQPLEKQDGRKYNGHKNFSEVLGDKRGHRPRMFPTELLNEAYGCYALLTIVKEQDVSIFTLAQQEDIAFIQPIQQALIDLGFFNNFTSRLTLDKTCLLEYGCSEFLGESDIVYSMFNNLYSGAKNKLLNTDGLEQVKFVVDSDGNTHRATEYELETIEKVEQELMDKLNSEFNYKLKRYTDIYNLSGKVRTQIQAKKKTALEEHFGCFYSYDYSAFVYRKSVGEIMSDLGLTTDIEAIEEKRKLLKEIKDDDEAISIRKEIWKMIDDLDDQVEKLFQESVQQIHEIYYDSQVKRMNNKYPPQRTRGFGKSLFEKRNKLALLLVRYSLARDLTAKEIHHIDTMLKNEN